MVEPLRTYECVRACDSAHTHTRTHTARLSHPRPTTNLAIEFIFLAPVDALFSQPGVDTSPPPPFLLFTPVIICRSVGEPDYRVLVIWSIEKRATGNSCSRGLITRLVARVSFNLGIRPSW